MATIDKEMADKIAAANGYYADDPRVMRIVEYTNAWGKQAYGIEYAHEVGKYSPSGYVNDPKVYWSAT